VSTLTRTRPSRIKPAKPVPLPTTRLERIFRWGLRIVVYALFFFLIAPIVVVILESFNGVNYLTFPLKGVSTEHYENFLSDSSWMNAAYLSARTAVVTMLLATVLGTMAAWGLKRSTSRMNPVFYALMYSPVVVPIIVVAIGYYFFFVDLKLIGNWLALAMVYAAIALPFVLVPVSAALQHFNPELEKAARTLGASPAKTLRFITFPNILGGIFAGAVFAFVTAFDETIIILFVSGSSAVTLPRKLWDSVRYDLNPTLAVAGTVLIVICVGLFLLAEAYSARNQRRRS
jgi:putative spermidine/putrescine transport system permease protein